MDIQIYLNKAKKYLLKVARIKKTPEAIASGFALGCFVGALPTFGFGFLIGFLIIFIWPKINKISLLAGVAIWNPLFSVPLYILSYKIGSFILGPSSTHYVYASIFGQAFDNTIRLLFGNFILAIFFSFISFFIIKNLIINIRKRKDRRKSKKKLF